eukprot:4847241-Prymnesium_polylepis.1
MAANGGPYYRKEGMNSRLFYDLDCDDRSPGVPRWIIGWKPIDATRSRDLDSDGSCGSYYARKNYESPHLPFGSTTWRVHCGSRGWQSLTVTLTANAYPFNPPIPPLPPPTPSFPPSPPWPLAAPSFPSPPSLPPPYVYPELVLSGVPPECNDPLNGAWTLEGVTGNGDPYYVNGNYTLYYEQDCDGPFRQDYSALTDPAPTHHNPPQHLSHTVHCRIPARSQAYPSGR